MAGDASDATLSLCSRALEYRRLTREGRIQLLVNRGVTRLRRREGEAAVADFDAVIALAPRHAEAHLNRGAALVQMNQHGEAVAAITEALSLGVLEPHKAYFNRAAAREALGDLRGAYEDYSTALQIQPDWGPANAELARFARGRQEHLAGVLNGAAAH
jgi:tetratricopeptide (TPR) repeat protein